MVIIVTNLSEFVTAIGSSGSIVQIAGEIGLDRSCTLAPNIMLRFENGAKITANSSVTLTGSNTTIDAPPVQIFGDNVHLGGSFVNAEWPAEWWGARNDGMATQDETTHLFIGAEVAINRALEEIARTGTQGTLVLTNRYAVCGTIYMQPGVALSGAARTYTYNFYEGTGSGAGVSKPTRGTLLVKFNDPVNPEAPDDPDRWVIDTKDCQGNVLQYNKLHADYSDYGDRFGARYVGCNISCLRIKDMDGSGNACVFGGIRLHSMQSGKIEDVDIDLHAFIGLALMAKVWNTELRNLHINVTGCSLYIGRSCTTLTAINVSCRSAKAGDQGPFRLTQPTSSSTFVIPLLHDHSLPPYLTKTEAGSANDNHYHMQSCGIIMEGSRCTFYSCTVERSDAVICGTNYDAKFISPYIEDIYLTFGWLFATQEYDIPSQRYELVIEDMLLGFDTFPSRAAENGEYKYLKLVPDGNGRNYLKYLPTFGTVRGVIKAHNVGRATCWENNSQCDYKIEENGQLVAWSYPSYFIYITPDVKQRNFYYDSYKLYKNADGTTELGDNPQYCKYKRIIIEGGKPARYLYDETNDQCWPKSNDNKTQSDLGKRKLQLGISRIAGTQAGELFARGLDNFVMTPVYASSQIDCGLTIIRKRFTIEVIDAAKYYYFMNPLKLYDCEITFKNSSSNTAIFTTNDSSLTSVLEVSRNCTINFIGNISFANGTFPKFIMLSGNREVHLTINVYNSLSGLSFNTPGSYIANYSDFGSGFVVDVEVMNDVIL